MCLCEQVSLLTWLLALVTIELILPHHSVWKVQPSSFTPPTAESASCSQQSTCSASNIRPLPEQCIGSSVTLRLNCNSILKCRNLLAAFGAYL